MIVITGAAGFIGSCVVARLNELGYTDLILVDHFNGAISFNNDNGVSFSEIKSQLNEDSGECEILKKKNLKEKKYATYYDKKDFLDKIVNDDVDNNIDCIIHMGACSSTTLQDAQYFQENNFEYTQRLIQWSLKSNVRFIYASSAATYGDGSAGYKDDEETIRRCAPLNLYGKSKQKLDEWVLENGIIDQVVGLKFFNVFGPNEYHKGDMRSVVAKAYQRVVDEGKMRLFKSHNSDYKDGEQKRDFIYIKDAVDIVIFFLDHPNINGIFNVGTGNAKTWNNLANALFKAVGRESHIEYFDMPINLRERYQYFTQADMSKLAANGYKKPFNKLEDAVLDYAKYLKNLKHL